MRLFERCTNCQLIRLSNVVAGVPTLCDECASEVCNICGEERRALVHTDTVLHPDDAIDGLFLHAFESIGVRS
jgi:hypothetical protein